MSGDLARWEAAEMAAEIIGQYFPDPDDLADAAEAIRQDAEEAGGPVIGVLARSASDQRARRRAAFERMLAEPPDEEGLYR